MTDSAATMSNRHEVPNTCPRFVNNNKDYVELAALQVQLRYLVDKNVNQSKFALNLNKKYLINTSKSNWLSWHAWPVCDSLTTVKKATKNLQRNDIKVI